MPEAGVAAGLMLFWFQTAAAQPGGKTEDWIAAARPAVERRCPPLGSAEAEIVVCGRRETEKYRLPIRPDGFDPKGMMESVSRERNKLLQEGDSGIGSCSTVGPGGWTGCGARQFKQRLEQEAK